MNPETRNCQSCKNPFAIEPEDFAFYKKMQVPPPTWCPECRFDRRLIFRNERILFRRKDDATGKEMLGGFPPGTPFPVYNRDYWWSDAWDQMQYGRDYDFSRPFFEQFRELMHTMPWSGRSVIGLVNSDYCDQAGYAKNCYLCFNCDYLEDCSNCVRCNNSKNCMDMLASQFSELCYEGVTINKSFRTFFSTDCEGSTDMWFSKQCVGSTNCFGCVNLRKKSYYIWNKPYSKEEYFKKLEEMNLGSFASIQKIKKEADAFWAKFPSKFMHGVRNVNSMGDMLNDTKNVKDSYYVNEGEDLKYCYNLYLKATNSYDYSVWGAAASQMYECLTCGEEVDSLKFCFDCWPSSRGLEYCIGCHSSSDLFGCVGLKKKQYCIFNKQYTKEEYEILRAKIIEHMNSMPFTDKLGRIYKYGEFFPPEFSPFAYNETMLQDAFPLSEAEAVAKGYVWRNVERKEYETTISSEALPDHINEVTDEILKEIIKCTECKKAYRITPVELAFLRRIGVPIPRSCGNCRVVRRFTLLNPPKFSKRKCQCTGVSDESNIYKNSVSHSHGTDRCSNEFETAYQTGSGIIYCESCYQTEVS